MRNIIDVEYQYFAFVVHKSKRHFFSDPTSGKLYVAGESGEIRRIAFNLG